MQLSKFDDVKVRNLIFVFSTYLLLNVIITKLML